MIARPRGQENHPPCASYAAGETVIAENPSRRSTLRSRRFVRGDCTRDGLLLAHYHFRNVSDPLFLFAIAISVWYAGVGPALFAFVLSGLADAYFFIEPIYSIYITREDVPHFVLFILFALLLTWFSAVRRRVERELLQSRDELEQEVAIRTQQASLLNLTHDTIFVRDMSDIITYWNRGAQELYGWTAEEAIGKHTHQLLRTVFPVPIDEIQAELMRTSRWEGEIEKTRADGTRVVVASRWSLRRNEQRSPIAILETNNDVTQRKRAEEEVRKLKEAQIAERNRAEEALHRAQAELAHVTRVTTVGEMTAAIAHEVNQPLAAVVTNAGACCAGSPAHRLTWRRPGRPSGVSSGMATGPAKLSRGFAPWLRNRLRSRTGWTSTKRSRRLSC